VKNGSIWKLATSILATALLTGTAAWLTMGRDLASKEYVQQYAPWVRERGVVMTNIANNSKQMSKLQSIVTTMIAEHRDLMVMQRELVTKINILVEKR